VGITARRHRLELTAMNARPLHDRLIVRRLEEGEQKSGGIIIRDTAKKKPQRGTVIAVGNGRLVRTIIVARGSNAEPSDVPCPAELGEVPVIREKGNGKRVPLHLKAGDMILFGKCTSQEVKLDGEEYLIMREDEVLAVL
jgi:chaperonin GroES